MSDFEWKWQSTSGWMKWFIYGGHNKTPSEHRYGRREKVTSNHDKSCRGSNEIFQCDVSRVTEDEKNVDACIGAACCPVLRSRRRHHWRIISSQRAGISSFADSQLPREESARHPFRRPVAPTAGTRCDTPACKACDPPSSRVLAETSTMCLAGHQCSCTVVE